MALDWEGTALSYSPDWALKWLEYVYKQTGIKPLLYIQANQAKLSKYAPFPNLIFAFWFPHGELEHPTFANWKNWAFWQNQASPLALDYFIGDPPHGKNNVDL